MVFLHNISNKEERGTTKVNGNGNKLKLFIWIITLAFLGGGGWFAFETKGNVSDNYLKKVDASATYLTQVQALEKYVTKEDFKQYREDNKEELTKIYDELQKINQKLSRMQ